MARLRFVLFRVLVAGLLAAGTAAVGRPVTAQETAQEGAEEADPVRADIPWSARTAYVATPGHLEVGLFHPLRWTVHPRLEVGTQPWLFVLNPNLQVKIGWKALSGEFGRLQLSSLHGVDCPTPWLRAVAREGVGGLLPADSDIPVIVGTTHSLLASRPVGPGLTVTSRVGLRVAWRSEEGDMETLDVPMLYARTAAYHNRFVFEGGATLNGRLTPRFGFVADAEFFIIPAGDGLFSFEQMGLAVWQAAPRLALTAGYQLVYGEYPFGTDLHVIPMIDLLWTIRK